MHAELFQVRAHLNPAVVFERMEVLVGAGNGLAHAFWALCDARLLGWSRRVPARESWSELLTRLGAEHRDRGDAGSGGR
jgi:hypothetical protein